MDHTDLDAAGQERLLFFGPQAPSRLDRDILQQLRSIILEQQTHRWLGELITSLPHFWAQIASALPDLGLSRSQEHLECLARWLWTGSFPADLERLPNVLLTPLTVITHLIQYSSFTEQRDRNLPNAELGHSRVAGLCTGLLSAIAVSCSSTGQDLSINGATAIRLASLVGAVVDLPTEDGLQPTNIHSLAVSWSADNQLQALEAILKQYPSDKVYVSVIYDVNRVTVTAHSAAGPALHDQLTASGFTVKDIDLNGRFHSPVHIPMLDQLLSYCESSTNLCFHPTSKSDTLFHLDAGKEIHDKTSLHELALRSILISRSDWYKTLLDILQTSKAQKPLDVVSFGPARFLSPSVMRTTRHRRLHISDLKTAPHLRLDYDGTSAQTSERPKLDTKAQMNQSSAEIAVVGMACHFPGAKSVTEYWDLLCSGKSMHQELPESKVSMDTTWRPQDSRKRYWGNFIDDCDAFDHQFFKKTPREAASMDPQQRLFLQIAYQTLESAEYFANEKRTNEVGCFVGIGSVDYDGNVASHPAGAYSALGTLRAFVSGKISHHFGWTGPSIAFDTACSSSAVAIHSACKAILNDECSMAFAGGANVITNSFLYQNLSAASFLSPSGASKAFDAQADGYCRGEGVGAVLLKRLSAAINDGDPIIGIIHGTAISQSQNCTPITVPHDESQVRLYQDVSRLAQVSPSDVTYVEAHGTGTVVGDPIECSSIRRVFGGSSRQETLHLGSVKGSIGHTEAASGAAALIKTLLMIHYASIPPQASFSSLNPAIPPLEGDKMCISRVLQPWTARSKIACINNYGAAGSNATMIVGESKVTVRQLTMTSMNSGLNLPIVLSALDDDSLRAFSATLRGWVDKKSLDLLNLDILPALAFKLDRQTNPSLPRSLILSCRTLKELLEKLSMFESGSSEVQSTSRVAERPIVLCFGGQTSTFVGLNRQLYEHTPLFKKRLDECDEACRSLGLSSIFPDIFANQPIKSITKLQTMLFSVQYASAMCWIDSGLHVSCLVGHSFGELTALAVSNALSLKDGLKLISRRAEALDDAAVMQDRGKMLALQCSREIADQLLDKLRLSQPQAQASIACFNGPQSFVLGGSSKSILAIQDLVKSNKELAASVKVKQLNVTHAFHSELMDPYVSTLGQITEHIHFKPPTIPIEHSCLKPMDVRLGQSFITNHLRQPVYFGDAVRRVSEKFSASCVLIEAGSHSKITDMAMRALGPSPSMSFVPAKLSSINAKQDLIDMTMVLWKEGVKVRYWNHHTSLRPTYSPVLLPPYQFNKHRHWLELKSKPPVEDGHLSNRHSKSSGLINFLGYSDKDHHRARFSVQLDSEVFQDLVKGHTVAGQGLCPVSVLVKVALDAYAFLQEEQAPHVTAEHLDVLAPLGLDDRRSVWLDLEEVNSGSLHWRFSVSSTLTEASSATTRHAMGELHPQPGATSSLKREFSRYARMVLHGRCSDLLEHNASTDMIQGRNIYRVFSDVVEYSESYRGVTKVGSNANEAAGRVRLPPSTLGYEPGSMINPILFDNFLQVAGLHVNCLSEKADTEVFICNRLERWARSPSVDSSIAPTQSYDVFTSFERLNDREVSSDIFVFESDTGKLTEVMMGASFRRISIDVLGKALSRISFSKMRQLSTPQSISRELSPMASSETLMDDVGALPKDIVTRETLTDDQDMPRKLKTLLSNITGIDTSHIDDQTTLEELGIDSLLMMEISGEINANLAQAIDSNVLSGAIYVQDLISHVWDVSREERGRAADYTHDKVTATASSSKSISKSNERRSISRQTELPITEFLSQQLGIPSQTLGLNTLLEEIGVDSLFSMELKTDIKDAYNIDIADDFPLESLSVRELQQLIFPKMSNEHSPNSYTGTTSTSETVQMAPSATGIALTQHANELQLSPEEILQPFQETKSDTDYFFRSAKLFGFHQNVHPKQFELVVAYAIAAFEHLGCPIRSATEGQVLPPVSHIPRHGKVVNQIWRILKEANLIATEGEQISRTSEPMPSARLDEMLNDLIVKHPQHANEHKLLSLTGSQLGPCLAGEKDAIGLIFGSKESKTLVSDVYANAPMFAAGTAMLIDFIKRLTNRVSTSNSPIKILEIGGGTGGTTTRVVEALRDLHIPLTYTFTDISASLVASARKRFADNQFMTFQVLDIEKTAPPELLGSQHFIISTNCIHATRNLVDSTTVIRSMLRDDGCLCLLELTRNLHWFDLVFGLLEGWWLFNDGREHALASEHQWNQALTQAGYGHVDWTCGDLPETNQLRMIIALSKEAPSQQVVKSHAMDHSTYVSNTAHLIRPVLMNTADSCLSTSVHDLSTFRLHNDDCRLREIATRQSEVDSYVARFSSQCSSVPNEKPAYEARLPLEGIKVLVVGASGSLGSHLAYCLAKDSRVSKIYCLNRQHTSDPLKYQMEALEAKELYMSPAEPSKIAALSADTSLPLLGLPKVTYEMLIREVTHIILNAWPMSFKRPISSFEKQFQTLQSLISLSSAIVTARPSLRIKFQFISSIGVVGHYPERHNGATVPEIKVESVDSVLAFGYGDAKLVCEHMLLQTLGRNEQHFQVSVIRPGQMTGSTLNTHWNHTEFFPALVKSSQTLGILPDLDGTLSWLPVNVAAKVITELLTSQQDSQVYHLENPTRHSWRLIIRRLAVLLHMERSDIVPFPVWLDAVQACGDIAGGGNPAFRLLDFFDKDFIRVNCGGVILQTDMIQTHSFSLNIGCRNSQQTSENDGYEDLLEKYVATWRLRGFLH